MMYKNVNGERIAMSESEIAEFNAEKTAWENASADRKLAEIRQIRTSKLNSTDWKVTSAKEQGTNLSTSFKNWRQGLRDISTTYTTESEYDELLARDEDGNLTHSVWSE